MDKEFEEIKEIDSIVTRIHENLRYITSLIKQLAEDDSMYHVNVEERADEISIPGKDYSALDNKFPSAIQKIHNSTKELHDLFDSLISNVGDLDIGIEDILSDIYKHYRSNIDKQSER